MKLPLYHNHRAITYANITHMKTNRLKLSFLNDSVFSQENGPVCNFCLIIPLSQKQSTYTVKKAPAGMSLTKLFPGREQFNYSPPGRVWLVTTSRLRTRKSLTFPARKSLVNDILAGNGKTAKLFRPGRVWLVTSRLGTGKSLSFFYSEYFIF